MPGTQAPIIRDADLSALHGNKIKGYVHHENGRILFIV